jgi:hypothetical protein
VQPSKQEHSLFSVMGQKPKGHATALIIAAIEADAEYYALHELGFVTVSATMLVSDSVYVGSGYEVQTPDL